jgi:hypothetical protein
MTNDMTATTRKGVKTMSMVKLPQQKITQAAEDVKWAVKGDDAEAAAETRKRARQCGPECVALLHHVVITDNFAAVTQRVRAASLLLDAGGFLASEAKEAGIFRDPAETDGAGERRGLTAHADRDTREI